MNIDSGNVQRRMHDGGEGGIVGCADQTLCF